VQVFGDEFSRRCDCRKHFRWTQNGTQYRRKAGTRSWEDAEEIKRQLQDQLAGRTPETRPEDSVRPLSEAVDIFLKDKRVQGVTPSVLGKYTCELDRLRRYCERQSVFTVQGIGAALSRARPYPGGLGRCEPTPYGWPSINSLGIVDMCGFPKDTYYYYKAWWGKEPSPQFFPHWNWEGREGDEISV
jgi:hypothetical protein